MTEKWDAGLHIQSFSLDMSGGVIPTAGGVVTTLERFLYVAHEAQIQRAWIVIEEGDVSKTAASMTVKLIQRLADGKDVDLTESLALNAVPSDPVELPLQRRPVDPGRAVYIQMTFSPTITTPWFASIIEVNGSLHFLMTDG